jgi:hypothetical protein
MPVTLLQLQLIASALLHITPHGAISDRFLDPSHVLRCLVVARCFVVASYIVVACLHVPLSEQSSVVDLHARLLFSRTGASAIVLVDHEQPAREMQVCAKKRLQASTRLLLMTLQTISTLTWLSVFYLHREDEVTWPIITFCELNVFLTQGQVQFEGLIVHALLQVLNEFILSKLICG